MTYQKTPHKYRKEGFYLTFPNGHVWSCVDLGKFDYIGGEVPPQETLDVLEDVGKLYDKMGGRYEGMIILYNETVDPEHQIRAHSFDELFIEIENYEKNNLTLASTITGK